MSLLIYFGNMTQDGFWKTCQVSFNSDGFPVVSTGYHVGAHSFGFYLRWQFFFLLKKCMTVQHSSLSLFCLSSDFQGASLFTPLKHD